MNLLGSFADSLAGKQDPTGQLLATLLAASDPLTVTDAARRAGLPKATAGRTTTRLVEAGLVLEDRTSGGRLIAVNTDHALYPTLRELLWVLHGAQPAPIGWAQHYAPDGNPYAVDGHDVTLPPSLTGPGPALANDVPDGPDLMSARAVVLQLQTMAGRLWVQGWLQSAYSTWHDERDRDLIHLVLHLNDALSQAEQVLIRATAPRRDAPPVVGRLTWAHATLAVNQEAIRCLRISEFLIAAVDRAITLRETQNSLTQLRTRLAFYESENSTREPSKVTDEIRDQVAAGEEAVVTATDALDRYYRHGGSPPRDAVNTAGERILASQLRIAAAELTTLARSMAAHPSFHAWATEHPTEAADFPLQPELDRSLPTRPRRHPWNPTP